jgi:THO complex subunit 1
VKDFVKKIKLEDNKIEMRKKILARQAERIAAARAKAVAAVTGTSSTQETTAEQTKPTTPATGTGSPLHPSLPAKPGSGSPSKATESSQAQPTPSSTTPTPVPAPTEHVPTPAPATPPVTTPPDEQILKLEEVTVSSFTEAIRPRDLKWGFFFAEQAALGVARPTHSP